MENQTVGIVGLGLIGASFARAFKKFSPDTEVLGANRTASVTEKALELGYIDGILNDESIAKCDMIVISVYSEAAVSFIEKHGSNISGDAIVIDCCGNKRDICGRLYALSHQYGFTFIGGHPMAGNQYSGMENSSEDMFVGSSMILVPENGVPSDSVLSRTEEFLRPLGFKDFVITTAEEHDRQIAYTSQLAHVLSSAYVKGATKRHPAGFTGGSYRDMTRVSQLNADMWSELFLANADYLTDEIDGVMNELKLYRDAVASGDEQTLKELLSEGDRIKKEEG